MARNKVQKANDGDSQWEKTTDGERKTSPRKKNRDGRQKTRVAKKISQQRRRKERKQETRPLPFLGGRIGRFDEA